MNEADFLKNTFGKTNPFKVPEGYFENLEKRVMDRLPEVDTPSRTVAREIPLWRRISPYVAAAAFFGVMAGGYLFYHDSNADAPLPVNKVSAVSANVSSISHNDDYNIDKAADYAMMDNEDFYAYLAGE